MQAQTSTNAQYRDILEAAEDSEGTEVAAAYALDEAATPRTAL